MKERIKTAVFAVGKIFQSATVEMIFGEREETKILNAAMRAGIACRTRRLADGEIAVSVARDSLETLTSRLTAIGCAPLSVSGPGRTARFRRRIGRRAGLLVGAVVFLGMLAFFSSILWKIEISGCDQLREEEVRTLLSACGVREGVFSRGIDADRVRNEMMQKNDGIAWMSVNVIGTYAFVEIREAKGKTAEPESGYSNIVAACDGQILSFETQHGSVLLWPGDTVREGELIVAGMIEQMDGDYRLVHAAGRVIARTEHTVRATCPYRIETETEGERVLSSIGISVFGKMINISLNRRLDAERCDIIQKKESPALPFGISLPGILEKTYLRERTQTEKNLSREEAAARAKELAYQSFLRDHPEAEMIARSVRVEYGEDACTATLHAVCRENIAKIVTFTAGS